MRGSLWFLFMSLYISTGRNVLVKTGNPSQWIEPVLNSSMQNQLQLLFDGFTPRYHAAQTMTNTLTLYPLSDAPLVDWEWWLTSMTCWPELPDCPDRPESFSTAGNVWPWTAKDTLVRRLTNYMMSSLIHHTHFVARCRVREMRNAFEAEPGLKSVMTPTDGLWSVWVKCVFADVFFSHLCIEV